MPLGHRRRPRCRKCKRPLQRVSALVRGSPPITVVARPGRPHHRDRNIHRDRGKVKAPNAIDRALAKAAGIAARHRAPPACLMAIDGLPMTVRRQVVAVVEENDLLRHYLREVTLARVIGCPSPHVRRGC